MLTDSLEVGNGDGAQRAFVRRLEALDWDFSSQLSESPFSWLHWHPCRFPSQLPSLLISRLSAVGDSVLDPFMGSGTTLVEAQRLGRASVGVDINPISSMIVRAKTLQVNHALLSQYVNKIRLKLEAEWDQLRLAEAPSSVQTVKWYTPDTLAGLLKIWSYLDEDNSPIKIVGQAAFSSILLACCREDRHWGYVCDNTEPKANRSADAKALFLRALTRFEQAYLSRDQQIYSAQAEVQVIEGDAASSLNSIGNGTVGCVVTSPPYLGVADYVKAQRLSMEWFSKEIEPFRRAEIGARSKRGRGTASTEYLRDLGGVFSECFRVLKPGGYMGIVFGQSPKRANIYDLFVDNLISIGFCKITETSRQVAMSRRMVASLSDEIVLILRKE